MTRRQSGTWWYYQTRSKVALCLCWGYSTKDYLYHKEGMLLLLSSIFLDLFVLFCLLVENQILKWFKVVAAELCFALSFSNISINIFCNISIICTRQKFRMQRWNGLIRICACIQELLITENVIRCLKLAADSSLILLGIIQNSFKIFNFFVRFLTHPPSPLWGNVSFEWVHTISLLALWFSCHNKS